MSVTQFKLILHKIVVRGYSQQIAPGKFVENIQSVAEDEIGRRSRVQVHVALDAGHRTDITVLPYYPVDRVG